MRLSRSIATFFLCCAVFALAACSPKPESAAEAFYLAAEEGNVEKASAQVSFADLDAGEMERLREKVQVVVAEVQGLIAANGGLERVEVLDSKVTADGSGAQIEVKLVFNNGKDRTESHRLSRQDEGWKIRLP